MSDNQTDPRNEEYEPEVPPTAPFILIAVIILIGILYMYAAQPNTATPNNTNGTAKIATEIIDRPQEDLGTHDIVSSTAYSDKISITYKTDEGTDTVSIDDKNLTRTPGEDNTIKLSVQHHDKAEIESGKVVKEDAEDPTYTATIYYDPEKREVKTYRLISLTKNGTKPATLVYSEANGITDTINLPVSSLNVVDDGTGTVEKISEYSDNGIWQTRWVIHSLP